MAAEPIPASFENTPLATPYLIAFITPAVITPAPPPATACELNAILNIITIPDGRFCIFITTTIKPAIM